MSDAFQTRELLVRAQQLFKQGQHQEVLVLCEQLAKYPAQSAEEWNQRGILWFRLKRFAEAEKCWREACLLQPEQIGYQLNLGTVQRRSGKWKAACQTLSRVVALDSANVDARRQSAECFQRQGNIAAARVEFETAVKLAPRDPVTLTAHGSFLHSLGEFREAINRLQESLTLDPKQPKAWDCCGDCHVRLNDFQGALGIFQTGIQHCPHDSQLHHNLGMLWLVSGEYESATNAFHSAIDCDPKNAAAFDGLGSSYYKLGKGAESLAAYREAVRLAPHFAQAWINLGTILTDVRQLAAALEALQHAQQLADSIPEVHNKLGIVYTHLGQPAEAEAAFQRALQLRPDFGIAIYNWAILHHETGNLTEAERLYAQAAERLPENKEVALNRVMLRLLQGDFAAGFPAYECRWETEGGQKNRRPTTAPPWRGEPLAGKTLLIKTEQGLGDAFQFIRYAGLAKRQGARVVVECRPPALPLLRSYPEVDQWILRDEPIPPADYQIPLMSLPGLFQTRVDTIPCDVPYLFADPALVQHWQKVVASLPGLRVGIAWQGSVTYLRDFGRSIPLRYFAPLAKVPGVTLISLQIGLGSEQLTNLQDAFPVVQLPGDIDRSAGAFMDTAAILKNLDLVISSDTSIVHLAGALGVPCWVALGVSPDWRWLLDREDSPWYPTMRLFRQREFGKWPELFQRIAEALKQQVQSVNQNGKRKAENR